MHENNCPINEVTADGKHVGRCWMTLEKGNCSRHGDVSKYQKYYMKSGKLTSENDMRKDRGETPWTN